jgi:hypothetical protein
MLQSAIYSQFLTDCLSFLGVIAALIFNVANMCRITRLTTLLAINLTASRWMVAVAKIVLGSLTPQPKTEINSNPQKYSLACRTEPYD